jgi:ribosomal protein S18 acetylase RimI-like enzyme
VTTSVVPVSIERVVQVRRLRSDEWERFRAIRIRALTDSPDAFGSTLAEEMALSDGDWQRRADPPDGAVFVVDGPDDLIALGIGTPAPGFPDAAAAYSMWVDPAERGKGLGTALIDAIKAWAKEAGYANLGLGVVTTNAQAIALYERLGFVDTGDRIPIRPDPEFTIQIMAMAFADRD